MSAPVLSRPFWEHERHWKLCAPGFVGLFNGTPFKGMAWRLLGAKVGKYLFDDGCLFTERSLVDVGDYVTLTARSVGGGLSRIWSACKKACSLLLPFLAPAPSTRR